MTANLERRVTALEEAETEPKELQAGWTWEHVWDFSMLTDGEKQELLTFTKSGLRPPDLPQEQHERLSAIFGKIRCRRRSRAQAEQEEAQKPFDLSRLSDAECDELEVLLRKDIEGGKDALSAEERARLNSFAGKVRARKKAV